MLVFPPLKYHPANILSPNRMDGLLVIVNEKNEFVYERAFRTEKQQSSTLEDSHSPLPFLIAYASLDTKDSSFTAEQHTAHKYRCATGHTLVFVRTGATKSLKKFFSQIEASLFHYILNVYTNDAEWMPAGFDESVAAIFRQFS